MSDEFERSKNQNVDELVTGTVNASTTTPVTADQIASWIRNETTSDVLARSALSTFFLEVPLGTQVAFLEQHDLTEDHALRLATEIEMLGRTIPLERRSRW